MSDFNETTRILNAESQEQLIKARNAELGKILKLSYVLNQLRCMRAQDIPDLPDTEQVDWALKVLSYRNYMRLNDKGDCLLNLKHCLSASISYTERKAVRQHLIQKLQATYKPIADYGQKMRDELPEIFAAVSPHSASFNGSNSSQTIAYTSEDQEHVPYARQLRELETQRRDNLLKLVVMRNRKCAYMKAAAELKMGPYLSHELELLYSQSRMNHIKAMLLRGFLVNELVTRSEHSLKALKEIEQFVDATLDQTEE